MKRKLLLIGIFLLLSVGIVVAVPSGGDCDHLSNPVPSDGASDVIITAKGVQTCIDVDPPAGCSLNITFQWYDFDSYFDAWFDYLAVNTSQTLCAWNTNVTCFTEGDYPVFAWRVLTEFDCDGQSYDVSECYYEFTPEECDLFYIYPALNTTDVCPCCDHICFGINNENGNNMNATIYGSYDGVNYFTWNKYFNISNGTYCFCMDDVYLAPTPEKKGEWIGASGIQAPGAKPADLVQHGCGISWEFSDNQEEEIQFTVRVPQRINLSYDVTLDMGWSSPATNKMCNWNLTYSTTELNEDTGKACEYYQDILVESSATAHGLITKRYYLTEINNTDRCIHFTIERDGNDPTDNLSDVANLHGICFSYYLDTNSIHIENATSPMRYNTTYFWYVNVTDTVTGESNVSDVYWFTTEDNTSHCPCGKEDLTTILNESLETEEEIEIEQEEMEEKEMISIIFMLIGIGLLVLGLLMEAFHRGDKEYDQIITIVFVLSMVFLFVAGASFLTAGVGQYVAYVWLNFVLGFLVLIFVAMKAFDFLESEE